MAFFRSFATKKPSYWAYWFLNKLGNEIVECSDKHIITKQKNDYQIIIWNYCYYKENFENGDRSALSETERDNVFTNKNTTVDLSISLNGEYRQTEYVIDNSTCAFHNWVKIGAPQYMTAEQISHLKEESKPKVSEKNIVSFNISETLEPQEVRMYILNSI